MPLCMVAMRRCSLLTLSCCDAWCSRLLLSCLAVKHKWCDFIMLDANGNCWYFSFRQAGTCTAIYFLFAARLCWCLRRLASAHDMCRVLPKSKSWWPCLVTPASPTVPTWQVSMKQCGLAFRSMAQSVAFIACLPCKMCQIGASLHEQRGPQISHSHATSYINVQCAPECLQAVVAEQQPSHSGQQQWSAIASSRASHAHIEHIYYITGPSFHEAAHVALDLMLDQLVDVMNAHKHLLHVMTVRPPFVPAAAFQSHSMCHTIWLWAVKAHWPLYSLVEQHAWQCPSNAISLPGNKVDISLLMQVGSAVLRCASLLGSKSAVLSKLKAHLFETGIHHSDHSLPALVTKVSLFTALPQSCYLPVTLEVRLHWQPVVSLADRLRGSESRCWHQAVYCM